jgi:hypothetical protein
MAKSDKEIFEEVQRLAAAGQTAEAQALFKGIQTKAENEPNEIIPGPKGIVFKRRGKIVIKDANGVWQFANASQRTARQKRAK